MSIEICKSAYHWPIMGSWNFIIVYGDARQQKFVNLQVWYSEKLVSSVVGQINGLVGSADRVISLIDIVLKEDCQTLKNPKTTASFIKSFTIRIKSVTFV